MRAGEPSVVAEMVKGAIAGAVATWVMDRATTYMYEAESEDARRREEAARRGTPSYEAAAERAAGLAGVRLDEARRGQAGVVMHWGLGIAAGAFYGALRSRARWIDRGQGLLFGTGFFLLVDELMNPALGLTKGPAAFPWQAHARGLGGHLVYGLVAETGLDLIGRTAPARTAHEETDDASRAAAR